MTEPTEARKVQTYCALCIARCGAIATVAGDRLVSLAPDPSHPTGAALCAKGRAAPELVHSPERLLYPMKRTRPKGEPDPGWQRISWDEALDTVAAAMRRFRETGHMGVPETAWHRARSVFYAFRLDDTGTEAEIARLHGATGYLADPHTAIGVAAARAHPAGQGVPMVAMATAHPAKFADAVARATGVHPALPPALADLLDRPERYVTLPNDLAAVEAQVRALARRNSPM